MLPIHHFSAIIQVISLEFFKFHGLNYVEAQYFGFLQQLAVSEPCSVPANSFIPFIVDDGLYG